MRIHQSCQLATLEPPPPEMQQLFGAIHGNSSYRDSLMATELMVGLGKLELAGIDFPAAKRMTKQALTAVAGNRLGYAIVCAAKPWR